MARVLLFTGRQAIAISLAALAYFGVRGFTEGSHEQAYRNAKRVLELEQRFQLDIESAVQQSIAEHDSLLTLANWIYIFGHWPVIVATLVWLAATRRENFYELRNAMFISGAVGLVIFATWAVMPPRLVGPDYVDTVTIRSNAYRLLQPPALVNKYAAVPSLHFGWNLLVGIAWAKATTNRAVRLAAVVMPVGMAFAVLATANHWTADVIVGGVVAGFGLATQRSASRMIPPNAVNRLGHTARRRLLGRRSGGPDTRNASGDVPSAAGGTGERPLSPPPGRPTNQADDWLSTHQPSPAGCGTSRRRTGELAGPTS